MIIKNPKSHMVDVIDAKTGTNRKVNFDAEAFGIDVNKGDLSNLMLM